VHEDRGVAVAREEALLRLWVRPGVQRSPGFSWTVAGAPDEVQALRSSNFVALSRDNPISATAFAKNDTACCAC
jgi:hypothetical protein